MQTFLPDASFAESARVLDRQRLGKQRVEVLQLLRTLAGPRGSGWSSHPCTRMWRGHEVALAVYGVAVCDEWISRGYRDTCRGKILELRCGPREGRSLGTPWWLGDERLHSSHRSALLGKDPEWYGQWGWHEHPMVIVPGQRMGYWWPTDRNRAGS